jgi:hypothetical protein
MAENPESLNSLVNQNGGTDNAVDALQRQVRVHDQANDNKTALDKMVEFVWHKDDTTLADLKSLQAKVNQDIKTGNNADLAGLTREIKTSVQADQSAMQSQNSVEFYSGSFLKAVPLFAGKNKVLMAASIGFNALDAVHMKDSGGQVAADLALGGFKGFALKKTFDVLGAKQFSLGAEGSTLAKVTSVGGVGLKGIAIGGLSRLYDTGLNRQNWVDAKGDVNPLNAVSAAARAAVDGRSMAMDAALFMGAHGVFTGVAKLGSAAIESSPALQKLESTAAGSFIKNSKMLPGMAMGATFGFSSGAVGEVTRERQAGESLDLSKIVKRASYQAITDGAAGATGAGATYAGHISAVRTDAPSTRTVPAGKMGLAFAGEDAPPVNNGGEHGENAGGHSENPADKTGTAGDQGEHRQQHIEGADKTAVNPALEPVIKTGDPATIVAPEAPAEKNGGHEMDEAFKPIFDQSVALARTAVQPGATTEDVINFFKYAAGEGQHVKGDMQNVATQASQYGNTAMESLIKHAYETTPETAATLDTGLALAEAANRHGATAEQDLAFLQYAYGPGKSAEVPLRVAAELSGDTSLDARLQEAYAGAHQLQRTPAVTNRISLDDMNPAAADVLKTILGNLPEDAQSHQLFRQNLHRWLDLVPDQHMVVKQYAQQTRYGVVAAVVDGKLNTDYLSQFPDRSLTSPDLLDKLKGLDQHRVATEQPEIPPAQPETSGNGQETANRNPYQPAIEHLGNGKVVNPQKLIEEFENTDGRAKQARAYLLSDFIGDMNDQQFSDWYANGLKQVNRPDLPAGTTNFGLMRVPGLEVLERPEVAAALTDPEHAAIDMKTLKDFLSAPPKGLTSPPLWQTEFIADRVELAAQKAALRPAPEGAEDQPVDPNKIVKEAVPGWFLKGIRDRGSSYDRNAGTATYPVDFDDNLAQMLENQRYLERQNPKYRESTPPNNNFSDRIVTLQKALDIQKTTSAPELVPQILKLGATDQSAVRGILDKLDLTTNAPEYTEMLKLVVPRAENIQDVKTLLDTMYFGKKSDKSAYQSKKDGKQNLFAENDRDNNLALGLTVANRLVPPGEPGNQRLQTIVNDVIRGQIRDPRPDFDGAPGGRGPGGKGPGGPGGRGPGKGEFRQRRNPEGDDQRTAPEGQSKVVPPVVTTAAPEQVDNSVKQALPGANESGSGDQNGTDLNRTGTGGGGDGQGEVDVGNDHVVLAGGTVVPNLSEVDLTPVVGADGVIKPVHAEHVSAEHDGAGKVEVATTDTGVNVRTSIETDSRTAAETDGAHQNGPGAVTNRGGVQPADTEEQTGGSHRGRQFQPPESDEDQDSGYRDRSSKSKPKGGRHDARGRRERGGAKADRYNRGFEDDDE